MTNDQKQVRDWMTAFGQETPDKPCIPSLEVRKLRAKLILEEAMETIHALGFFISFIGKKDGYQWNYVPAFDTYDFTSRDSYVDNKISLAEIADGCEDLKVVTEGTLVACGLIDYKNYKGPLSIQNNDPLFDEVMRSNNSKMWSYEETQKLIKPNGEVHDDYEIYNHTRDAIGFTHLQKYIVKNKDGKVIKSPSFNPPQLDKIIKEL